MTSQTPGNVPPIEDWSLLLDGKVAVVTGGGGGIGRGISTLFAEHGAMVEIAEIDAALANSTVEEITATGGKARAHVVDVRDENDVATLQKNVLETHGCIDVLVNNVGDYRPLVRFLDSSPASWKEMYDINLHHVFLVTHAFLQSMVDGGGGSIINVHSVEGMRGYPGDPVYGSMKAAVNHFSTCLASGFGRRGVRVNGIGVDLTQTSQVDYISGYEDVDHLWEAWAPVGRLGWPEDQARVALFLASDLSAFVTGHNIPVDGGSHAGGGWFFSPETKRFVNRPKTL
ncbi:MAG: SDR family oxidoreductase [Acidimicrobiales bacterium]|jgi:NAD(P)-dependent dehydrogenase (short-subunit alcohol dehydrogenase family)|nr:SDR family oxidoreductase [Acidimicrobiales bacterium]MDP6299094.1 SDR family oxidoreductase [Acidimicrobiales bacterium]HJM28010.1 SDR family oxidoreductase [Acidimicrobiales bacterium]HJM97387.1 SDR family oxidoreductase [Acidimicrobiales bacterium]